MTDTGNRTPPAPGNTQALSQERMPIKAYLKQFSQAFSLLIPKVAKNFYNVELVLDQFASQLKDPKKGKALAECSNESVGASIKNCCLLGLQPGYGVDTAEIYFIAYNKVCTAQISYKGMETLLMRTGRFQRTRSEPIWDGDTFEQWDGNEGAQFKYQPGNEKKTLIGAFAMAETNEGVVYIGHMTSDEIDYTEETTRKSANKTPAWRDWPDRMYRKTVLKKLIRDIPRMGVDPTLERAIIIDVENDKAIDVATSPKALAAGMK